MLSPTPTLPSVTPCWPALKMLPPEVMPFIGLVTIGCCTEKPPFAADTCEGARKSVTPHAEDVKCLGMAGRY